ncbi:MAG: outer membrane beta-barrel protein [Alphaproteobacteria bacterium]|nr:outer membrane beta-barrel protein [Alphaproteobacteria bacterium]
MKKVSLLALVLALGASEAAISAADGGTPAPCPNGFKGFFLGGNIGYGVGGGRQIFVDANDTAQNEFGTRNKIAIRGVDGGVNVGYNYVWGNRWGLGLEFVANWASSDGKLLTFNNEVAPTTVYQTRAKLNNSLQVRANFSYVICNLVAPKVILGWDNSQWKQSFKRGEGSDRIDAADIVASGHHNKRYNGFLFGFGVDFLAMKHVIFGFEYTGVATGSKKFTDAFELRGDTHTVTEQFRPQYNKFALTAKVIY